MSDTLDRNKPFSECLGDSRASFYQGGRYFDSLGNAISDEDASKPTDGGTFVSQVEQRVEEEMAKINAKKPLKLVDDTNPHTNSTADIEKARARAKTRNKPKVVEPEPSEEQARMGDQLKEMHAAEVRRLVELAGLTPHRGRGSKAKNIQLLLDNTE